MPPLTEKNIFYIFKNVMYVGPVVDNDMKKQGVMMMIGGKIWFYQLHNLEILF